METINQIKSLLVVLEKELLEEKRKSINSEDLLYCESVEETKKLLDQGADHFTMQKQKNRSKCYLKLELM